MSPTRPSKPKAVSRRVAPVRATSGAGFGFEDQISAGLLLGMLQGRALPGLDRPMRRLQAQVEALGWSIDDLLATATDGKGDRRLAISVKGNPQVTAAGLPDDFLVRAWALWQSDVSPFDRETDVLALAIRSRPQPAFDAAWAEIKTAALSADPALGLARIRASRAQARVFDKIKTAAPGEATDAETLALIERLEVLPYDFQLEPSNDRSRAIADCRTLVSSGTIEAAKTLWEALVGIAESVRVGRGTVNLADLIRELRNDHELHDPCDFRADWTAWARLTSDVRDRTATDLPSGRRLARPEAATQVADAVEAARATVVVGPSGSGKSALVKTTLDERFSDSRQVWLGPDEVSAVLSAVRRPAISLRHSPWDSLRASTSSRNILVLDAAERIAPDDLTALRTLMSSMAQDPAWRLVIVTQPQGWSDRAWAFAGFADSHIVEPKTPAPSEIAGLLVDTPGLAWVCGHPAVLTAATNLKVLGWVVQAGAGLDGGVVSHIDLVNALWRRWTEGRLDRSALMMSLGEREAAFQRAFPLTDFDPAMLGVLSDAPQSFPVRRDEVTNRIAFEHDLAADWARFQYLKQFSTDLDRWGDLAAQPQWVEASRLLGQHLLRQPGQEGASAWDDALGAAQAAPLDGLADLLLDALVLDPEALQWLEARAEALFADDGRRLNRIAARFRHLGSLAVRSTPPDGEEDLALYLDVQQRRLLLWRWSPLLAFLIAHHDRVARLVSDPIAKLIAAWLKEAPRQFSDGSPYVFRAGLAELALEMAREVQALKAAGRVFLDGTQDIYATAIAGAADAPETVGDWMLEMAGRRDISPVIERRAGEIDAARAVRRPSTPARTTPYSAPVASRSLFARRRLPPWPLGARRTIDRDYRRAALAMGALGPLMGARPDAAAEALPALLIEDQPFEDEHRRAFESDLGLEHGDNTYPTAFWISPFFLFLQTAPRIGLGALLALAEFCSQQWLAEVSSRLGAAPEPLSLEAAGRTHPYPGGFGLFAASQTSSLSNGHLYCALDALERHLVAQLDLGRDVDAALKTILACPSLATLGVLVNVGKHRPALFMGVLEPLASRPELYVLDDRRVAQTSIGFDALHWSRHGDLVFQLARDWFVAPHRRLTLTTAIAQLAHDAPAFAARLRTLMDGWPVPDEPKAALEQRLLIATLDANNHQAGEDGGFMVSLPDDVASAARDWELGGADRLATLQIPWHAERAILAEATLDDDRAAWLWTKVQAEPDPADEPDPILPGPRVPAAAALLVCAPAWLAANPEAAAACEAVVAAEAERVPDDWDEARVGGSRLDESLKFAAFAILHLWLRDPGNSQWERSLVRLLTSGAPAPLSVIFELGQARRDILGGVWPRLHQLLILRSALGPLRPDFDDGPEIARRWSWWLARLRRARLDGDGVGWANVRIERVHAGLARLARLRGRCFTRSGVSEWRRRFDPEEATSPSLETHALKAGLAWLIDGKASGDLEVDRTLALDLWRVEARRQREKADAQDREYALPSQTLGYDLLRFMARLALASDREGAAALWRAIFEHGPAAHHAIRIFLDGLFHALLGDVDPDLFMVVWTDVIDYALSGVWPTQDRLWFHEERTLGGVLGFGEETALARLEPTAIARLTGRYAVWAQGNLRASRESLPRYARFLASSAGRPLRMAGLKQLAAALAPAVIGETSVLEDGGVDALGSLIHAVLRDDLPALRADRTAYEAVVTLVGRIALTASPMALVLQERVAGLR